MTDLPDLFDLSDQVAVVTGGAGLLGSEFCRTLVEAGARVIVADLNGKAAEEQASILNKTFHTPIDQGTDIRAIGWSTDVTDRDSVIDLVETTLHHFKRLDILVNSAALDPKFDSENIGKHTNSFEDLPLTLWQQALDVNLTGMFLCCQAAARTMLERGRGTIINICSIYGVVGPDQRLYQEAAGPTQYKPVHYSVTKAGVLGLTRYLAAYYAGKNIRVNALTPGGIYNHHSDSFVQAYANRTVLGRMANKDEMNGALLYLASEASSYMTGANLVVDGGWTTW